MRSSSTLDVAQSILVIPSRNEQALVEKINEALKQRASRSAAHDGIAHQAIGVAKATLQPGEAIEKQIALLKPQAWTHLAVFVTNIVAARAVQNANSKIPVVVYGEADPVQFCLADSMQRPGRNVTGYVNYLSDDEFKMLETLVDGFPHIKTVYQMIADSSFYISDCDPNVPSPKPAKPPCVAGVRPFEPSLMWWQQSPAVFVHAKRLGIEMKFMMLCRPADFALIPQIEPGRDDVGFAFAYQGLFWNNADALVAQVALSRRPAIYGRRRFVEKGGLMSLQPIFDADDDRAVINMLLQVIDGRSPATLPIQTPRGFRLSVNASEAAAQGLRPSLKLLRRADEIIAKEARP